MCCFLLVEGEIIVVVGLRMVLVDVPSEARRTTSNNKDGGNRERTSILVDGCMNSKERERTRENE